MTLFVWLVVREVVKESHVQLEAQRTPCALQSIERWYVGVFLQLWPIEKDQHSIKTRAEKARFCFPDPTLTLAAAQKFQLQKLSLFMESQSHGSSNTNGTKKAWWTKSLAVLYMYYNVLYRQSNKKSKSNQRLFFGGWMYYGSSCLSWITLVFLKKVHC